MYIIYSTFIGDLVSTSMPWRHQVLMSHVDKARLQQVDSVETSVTVLDDLLPLLPVLAQRRAAGVFNVVNPGTVSYPEIVAASATGRKY